MICNITSPKWRLDDQSAARYIVRTELSSDAYREDWNIEGFQFSVEFPLCGTGTGKPWLTDSGRWMGVVTGVKLGGYVGVSFSPGDGDEPPNYHIGTPAGRASAKLIAAMKVAAKAAPVSAEQIAKVFENRNRLIAEIVAIRV